MIKRKDIVERPQPIPHRDVHGDPVFPERGTKWVRGKVLSVDKQPGFGLAPDVNVATIEVEGAPPVALDVAFLRKV